MMQSSKFNRVKNQNHYALAMEEALKRHENSIKLDILNKQNAFQQFKKDLNSTDK